MTETSTLFDGAQGLRPFALFDVTVGPPVSMGGEGPGERRFIPITGGVVSGEIAGRVLPGGGDWQTVWPDRLELSAHYILETTGGALIEVRSDGMRHGPPEVLARLARGENVDPRAYYFRTALRFATGAPGLERLNPMLAIGMGVRAPAGVTLRVFEVL